MAKRGPPPRSPWRSARASERRSARSVPSWIPARRAPSVAAARAAGSRRRSADSRRPCYSPRRPAWARLIGTREGERMNRKRGGGATTGVQAAEIVREYGPFPDAPRVNGVTFDGTHVWFAARDALHAVDPSSGRAVRHIDVPSDAGTAFDGRHFYQLVADRIHKVDPATGAIVATLPAPGKGSDSGLTWAEGTLWVG